MDGAMILALALEVSAATLVTWLTWRAATGALARNSLAGVRTRATMSSEAAWLIGHRAAFRPTAISASMTVAWCLLAMIVAPLRNPISDLVATVVLLGGAFVSLSAAGRAVRRASLDH